MQNRTHFFEIKEFKESFVEYCVYPIFARRQGSFNGHQEMFSVFLTVDLLFESRAEETVIETFYISDNHST